MEMKTLTEQLNEFDVKTINFDGVQQSYRESGKGQTIVFLHGISSGSGSWIKQFQDLSQHFHLLAWDAPGYGQSDVLTTQQPNARDYAKRLKAMLDALEIDRFILVGHSLGAMQAAAFQRLFPEKVKALLLVNAAQGYKDFDEDQQKQVFKKRPKMLSELGASGMAQSRGPHLVAHATPEALALIEAVMQSITLEGFTQASYLLAYDSIQSYLEKNQPNTHVLMGMSDGITPPKDIQAFADAYALTNIYTIEDAGHLSYLDQPEQFNKILLSLQQAQM